MDQFSYISNAEAAAIDDLYQQYKANPDTVDFGWKKFFEGFDLGHQRFTGNGKAAVSEDFLKEIHVLNLIRGYRQRGHLFTKTNPVRERRKYARLSPLKTSASKKQTSKKHLMPGWKYVLAQQNLRI